MTTPDPNSAASLDLGTDNNLYEQERNCLMYCALRFDGYGYQEKMKFDFIDGLDALIKHDVMPTAPEAQMALFFALQRYFGKWGGEYDGYWSDSYQAYRKLFLLCYAYEIAPEFQTREMREYYEQWEQSYKPQREAWADLIRRIDAATVYNPESGLVLGTWRPPVDAYEVVWRELKG